MLEATLRDRARQLLTASGRSDVPPFMVMDVMAAAARIEADGGHVIHMEVGQPAASAPKAGDIGGPCRPRRREDRLYLRARHCLAARTHRQALPRGLWLRRGCLAGRGHHRLVGRVYSGVSCHVRARRPRCGDGARLSAISSYSDRARLRAGADRDLERDPSRADRRSFARRPPPDAAGKACWLEARPIPRER